MKLLYNKEFFYTKTKLVIFKITLPSANLDMVHSTLVSNGLIFSGDITVDIKLVTFYCYPILVN